MINVVLLNVHTCEVTFTMGATFEPSANVNHQVQMWRPTM